MILTDVPLQWPVPYYTVVMSCQRMSMLPSVSLRPSEQSNSLTGVQLDSSLVSVTSPLHTFQAEISPRLPDHSVCFLTLLLSQVHGVVLITSSISCTRSVPSFTGTLVKVWKKVNSQRPVRILRLWKKTTRRSVYDLPSSTKLFLTSD